MRTPAIAWIALGLATAAAGQAPAAPASSPCPAPRVSILILGSFHMDNPGQDAVNLKSDDVLAPRRQREIEELTRLLARYEPTKIVIEAAYRSEKWPDAYARYLKDDYTLGRNEIEQVGFRLGRQRNLPTIHPVDYPMWMNGLLPSERGEPRPKAPEPTPTPGPAAAAAPAAPAKAMPAYLARSDELMRTGTFIDVFRYINSDAYIRADHGYYMNLLAPSETIAIYEGTDLVTNWYKRNLRIFTNLRRVAEPGDRILLLIGSGHLKILKDLARDTESMCLADTEAYLR